MLDARGHAVTCLGLPPCETRHDTTGMSIPRSAGSLRARLQGSRHGHFTGTDVLHDGTFIGSDFLRTDVPPASTRHQTLLARYAVCGRELATTAYHDMDSHLA